MNTKNIITTIGFAFITCLAANAQQGVMISETTGQTPDPSAILEVESTDKGVLFPQISLSSITDVSGIAGNAPADGLMVFNTSANLNGQGYYYWFDNQWNAMGNEGGIELMTYSEMENYANTREGKVVYVTTDCYEGLWYYGKAGRSNGTGYTAASSTSDGWFQMEIEGSADFYGPSQSFACSDERLKEEIKTIAAPLETISQLGGVNYFWKTEGEYSEYNRGKTKAQQVGLIAQEVEKILPGMVHTVSEDERGDIKGIDYGAMVGLLIEGMKKQQAQIEALQKEIQTIEQ